MAKILISSLGTGSIVKDSEDDYKSTLYSIDNVEYSGNFVAKVLIDHLKINKSIFIGTTKSMWDNLYYTFDGDNEEVLDTITNQKNSFKIERNILETIENQLDFYLKNDGSKVLLMEYSEHNSSEVWNNFEKLLGLNSFIEDGDEVYLDITHGFRYMPILNVFLLEFLEILRGKNINIKGIYYGMLGDEKSEIIDFKIFFELLEWSKAVSLFKHNSDASLLIALLTKYSKDSDTTNIFRQFDNNLKLANMSSLWEFMRGASRKIKKLSESDNKIIKMLSNDILDMTLRLDKDKQSDFQYELALWLFENKSYALAYIALYEAIITKSCELKSYDINDYKLREEAKTKIGHDKFGKHFYTKYPDSLSVIRNSIVHQDGKRKNMVLQDIKKLELFLKEFKEYFEY
ncbi:MAG: TIGR02221 family CRISPR-associated protein [Arcobacteraceae bacterium]|jgi:CRISPR-associated Csx2 family protein|nr:TIGR02221 family CRISPR-associated protein [Arcobacteraceae bacterium]